MIQLHHWLACSPALATAWLQSIHADVLPCYSLSITNNVCKLLHLEVSAPTMPSCAVYDVIVTAHKYTSSTPILPHPSSDCGLLQSEHYSPGSSRHSHAEHSMLLLCTTQVPACRPPHPPHLKLRPPGHVGLRRLRQRVPSHRVFLKAAVRLQGHQLAPRVHTSHQRPLEAHPNGAGGHVRAGSRQQRQRQQQQRQRQRK